MRTPLTTDLKLLAVVGPPFVTVDSALDACIKAEAGGVTSLQVRWKNIAASELLRLTRQIVNSLSIPVYVNDRVDVAMAGGAAGVHLGADDLDPVRVRTFAPPSFRIGVSVGTEEEAENVLDADVDYWSIGATYQTQSKKDAGEPIGTEGFARLASLAPKKMPVIAIGGIDPTNLADILEAGARGVAVISAIFEEGEIEGNARALRNIIDEMI